MAEAKKRVQEWNPESWRTEANKQRLLSIKTVRGYNDTCQPYSHLRKGIRAVDDLARAEAVDQKFDLVTCLAFIEYATMMKDCGTREPIISEVLFYTKALAPLEKEVPNFGPQALVSSALVVGNYCKPNNPSTPQAEAVFAKMRDAYLKAHRRG
jgi:hypothetical protein